MNPKCGNCGYDLTLTPPDMRNTEVRCPGGCGQVLKDVDKCPGCGHVLRTTTYDSCACGD